MFMFCALLMKCGYDKFDKGIAVMSRSPIIETQTVLVSGVDDYADWITRKLLGIRIEADPDEWFFSVHYKLFIALIMRSRSNLCVIPIPARFYLTHTIYSKRVDKTDSYGV